MRVALTESPQETPAKGTPVVPEAIKGESG